MFPIYKHFNEPLTRRGSFEDGAEAFCDSLLALALQTDPHNAEALQALASVRISQNRPDEAKEYVERSWAVWKDLEPGMLDVGI
jgi:cytochrome c-type biogenesis protein CcmH/NrfG